MLHCTCSIVPKEVLERLAGDKKLSAELRKAAADSAKLSDALRSLRYQYGVLAGLALAAGAHLVDLAASPKVTVYDSRYTQTLPGTPVKSPKTSKDASALCCFSVLCCVVVFFLCVFGCFSVDNAGMT